MPDVAVLDIKMPRLDGMELLQKVRQKSGLKPPTSVGKDPTVRRRRSKPLNPSTLVGGGSVLWKAKRSMPTQRS